MWSKNAKRQEILVRAPRLISRDEMNLAEFPLTVLSTRTDPSIKTLEFSDSIRGKNGELVDRKWIITGADKFGLPTASDDEVLLGLLKLSVDKGLKERRVEFTRYEIMKILRWSTEGRNYTRLQKSLDRLTGVRIKATNSFYDNDLKSYSTRNFGLLDAYEINDGRESAKPSFFSWSEVLFKSFQVGFIKKLDLDLYLDLKSAVSKRLYRYLDKHFWYKSRICHDLFVLAHEKIGISRNYRYASSIRQQLDPAIKELTERGFLSGCEIIPKGRGADIVFYAGNTNRQTQKEVANSDDSLSDALIARGINPTQVPRLLKDRGEEAIARIKKIIEYFDFLVQSGSTRISKNPAGFLYRAVQEPYLFSLPNEKPQQPTLNLNSSASIKREAKVGASLEAEYLVERKRELERLKSNVEPSLIDQIRGDVEKALSKLQGLISESRFLEAVNHGVEEKLASLFALPDYSEWAQVQKRA